MSTPIDTVVAHPALAGCARVDAALDVLLGDRAGGHPSADGDTELALGESGEGASVSAAAGVALWSATDVELTELVRGG